MPTLRDCSLLALSAVPRATLLLEEDPIGWATLGLELREVVAELREDEPGFTWGSLAVAAELLALVEEELLALVAELLDAVEPFLVF